MADVFISYARADERSAERAAEALRAEGYDVWRDNALPVHRPYADVIEERLKAAKAVVVLWSAEAAKSEWVRAEADVARKAGTLVQARLDPALPPMPFSQIQSADLSAWAGDSESANWRTLMASVEALAGKRAARPEDSAAFKVRSICVLPFHNMSGDPEQEYFSDGISEDITTDLAKFSALCVTARNTAFTYKGAAVDVCAVARRLGVSHVLEGSVRKVAGRVRINAQLINGASGEHVWAERYDRDLTDIFAIQDDISEAIVAALKLKLLPEEKEAIAHRETTNVEAYNLYLMARQFWITGDFGDRRREERVIRLCTLATEVDPKYAQAWALLALAQANLVFGFMSDEPLDDGLAAAERAITLDPGIAEARLPKAWHFAEIGEHDKAAAELATAVRLGPESWEVNKEAARLCYRLRKIKQATQYLERATSLVVDDFHGWGMLMACYSALGDAPGIRRCAERLGKQIPEVLVRTPDNGAALIFGALALATSGNAQRAREWIDRALLLDPKNMMMRYNLAWGLAKVFREDDAAIGAIAPVFEGAGRNIIRLAANDPNLDGLRGDPRFDEALSAAKKRVGLA